MITPIGIKRNSYYDITQAVVTMRDLSR
jgi:hypothetical protein